MDTQAAVACVKAEGKINNRVGATRGAGLLRGLAMWDPFITLRTIQINHPEVLFSKACQLLLGTGVPSMIGGREDPITIKPVGPALNLSFPRTHPNLSLIHI